MYPVLPLRDIVVFPHMIVPLFVGRDKSVRALEDVMKDDKQILLVAQKNAAQDDPAEEDIYDIGTVSTVLQLLKLPDGTVKVLVEGVRRAKINRFEDNPDFFLVEGELISEEAGADDETEALCRTVITQFEQYIKLNKKIPSEVMVCRIDCIRRNVATHNCFDFTTRGNALFECEGILESGNRGLKAWNVSTR